MKLVFASDSFKGSLSCAATAALLTEAAHEVYGDCECIGVPTADGGEGTADAVVAALHGRKVSAVVRDPLMKPVAAAYGLCGGKAVIEMAAASGLTLVPEPLRDPLLTATCGTGELILDALDRGCREMFIAIGGSATNDGGMGCLTALGARFLDADGKALQGRGKDLASVVSIDLGRLDKRLSQTRFTVLCDVRNPLCGADGATRVYAAQKGAAPAVTELLESGMQNYRDVIKKQYGIDCDTIAGAGAAGGLGAALKVFLHAQMRSGIDAVLDLIGFDDLLQGADFVVTGEGRADSQSCCGKVMQGVGLRAKAHGVPVYGLCGSLGDGAQQLLQYGVTALFPVVADDVSVAASMADPARYYYNAAVAMFRQIQSARLR